MKRLVYSPSVNVWIKSDTGVFDLTPYVTGFQIDRRVGEVSAASVTFRNPRVTDERNFKKTRFMFTEHIANDGSVRPMFYPMDPIIITLTRLKGRPIQVFTGYCDTTPYVQLMPGEATLTASCTLKRLVHTYWDPALPFVRDFMLTNGWLVTDSGTTVNTKVEKSKSKTLTDSSLGLLLFNVLAEVGGWDPKNIFITGLPGNIGNIVINLYKDTVEDINPAQGEGKLERELADIFNKIIGASAYGSNAGQANLSGGSGQTGTTPVAPSDAPNVISQWINEADRIAKHVTHYDQSNPPNTRSVSSIATKDGAYIFDCSSFISYMMRFINRYDKDYGEVSGWFARNYGAAGPGKYLTIWANDAHVFAEVKEGNGSKFIGTSGFIERSNSDNSSYGHSHTIGWMNSYPTDGFTARHVPGL